MPNKEYYLYVKGEAIPISEEVYKAYWKITEHEKYLQKRIASMELFHFHH